MIRKLISLGLLLFIVIMLVQTISKNNICPSAVKAQSYNNEYLTNMTLCPFCNNPVDANGNCPNCNNVNIIGNYASCTCPWCQADYICADGHVCPDDDPDGGDDPNAQCQCFYCGVWYNCFTIHTCDTGGGYTGGGTTPDPPVTCQCCGQAVANCLCDKCTVCGGIKNGYNISGTCIQCTCPNDEVFDPYNIVYHNSDMQYVTNDWTTTQFEEFIFQCFNDLVFNFILGTFYSILENYIDVYWDDNGNLLPNLMIEHTISGYYVPTHNWSGKVTVAQVNNKICEVQEYSDSFNVNRQVGQASYQNRIVNSSTGTVLTYLWNNYLDGGSISDVRCGKPSVGESLFISCQL